MTDTLETATEATESIAKELTKIVVASTVQTAAAYAGAFVALSAIGFVVQKRQERKAKQSAPKLVAE